MVLNITTIVQIYLADNYAELTSVGLPCILRLGMGFLPVLNVKVYHELVIINFVLSFYLIIYLSFVAYWVHPLQTNMCFANY